MHRVGRSASSSSNYAHHSSVASIASEEAGEKPKVTYEKIEKKFLLAYRLLEGAEGKALESRKLLKAGLQWLREHHQVASEQVREMRSQLCRKEEEKNCELNRARNIHEEELRFVENEHSQHILSLSREFCQREQAYMDIISRSLRQLHTAKRLWNKNLHEVKDRVGALSQTLKAQSHVEGRNRAVYEGLSKLSSEMLELEEDPAMEELSLMSAREEERGTIDVSSIGRVSGELHALDAEAEEPEFEKCLLRMIQWGFFSAGNLPCIRQLADILSSLEKPEHIVEEPIYPVLMEALRLSVNTEEPLMDSLNQWVANPSQVIMRDISNLDDMCVHKQD